MFAQLITLIPTAVTAVKSLLGLFKSSKTQEVVEDVVEIIEDVIELKDDVEALKKEFD